MNDDLLACLGDCLSSDESLAVAQELAFGEFPMDQNELHIRLAGWWSENAWLLTSERVHSMRNRES